MEETPETIEVQHRRWHALQQHWESLPENVVLDVGDAVERFRLGLLGLRQIENFTVEILGILLQYMQYPGREWFFESMEHVYDNYGALEGALCFSQLMTLVEALGIDLIARMHAWGVYQQRQQFVYRFETMIGYDIVLKKVTFTELEDLYANRLPT